MAFEDVENGTKYWEDIFRRFPNMKYYVFKVQKSLNIDYHSFVDPKDAVEYEDNGPPGQKMQKSAADLAREERDRQNMMFLQGALRNIEELVAALSQRIMELDTEEQEAAASGKDTDALRADRANKKQQLQILMDNVAVLSANMQALYSKSLEMGTTDFDLEAIENVMRETSAMLAMLQDGDDYDPELEGEVGGAEQGALELSDEVEWLALDDSLTSELFAQLDMIQDILITPENFLATDISRRPKDWNEVRMKRVLMREYVDRLEGVDEITIKERRAQRIAAEERSMVKEVAERGRLLNMPVLRKVSTKSQRLAALAAALAITDDNFDPDSIDRRPLAWQAVKLRRAITKEDIYRRNGMDEKSIADQRKALLEEEEKRMLGEVKKYGMVLSIGAPRATDTPYKASKLKISPETYDPQDHNKRPEGWFELRHQRVLVREHADRLAGVSEDSIFESRLQKEREEEDAMMEEVASGGRVISVRYDLNTEVRTTGAKADAVMKFTPSNFDPSDPNKRPKGWFELRTKRVLIREQADRDAGISEEAIAELRSRRELEEEALMITEVMSSGAVLGAGVQSNQQKIVITKNNFVANDSTFRPPGWAELRLRRVMFKESIDRIAGIDEENIADMRSDREIKEEALMVDEVLCLGRVLGVGESSGTLIPKVSVVVISSATFDPSIPSKRPTGWVEARTKRVMMKEQIDRTKGVSEELILGNRAFKTDREEQLMLEEVATYGHLVGVGGLLEEGELPLQVPVLIFNKDNFDPMYPSKRPDGWVAARKKRVYKKERIEALRGMTSGAIEESHRQREIDVRIFSFFLLC